MLPGQLEQTEVSDEYLAPTEMYSIFFFNFSF